MRQYIDDTFAKKWVHFSTCHYALYFKTGNTLKNISDIGYLLPEQLSVSKYDSPKKQHRMSEVCWENVTRSIDKFWRDKNLKYYTSLWENKRVE